MTLTGITIRNAAPREKPYKISDERGLFLLVQPSGGKLWRYKVRQHGTEKKLSLGVYPQVSLALARKFADAARERVALGKDPVAERRT